MKRQLKVFLLLVIFLVAVQTMVFAQVTILYQDSFSGSPEEYLAGRVPEISYTGQGWISPLIPALVNWQADGTTERPVDNHNRNAFLPFVPEAGKVYRLSLEVNPTEGNAPAEWFGVGFTADCPQTTIFAHDTVGAGPWILQSWDRSLPSNTFTGPGTAGEARHPAASGWVKLEIVLDTTREDWRAEWYYNGELVRTYLYWGNPTINYVGFGAMRQAAGQVRNFLLTVEER
ncbi:MAG TPA: hypothetical protein GXX57_06445 [Firmicutes bacterium]|nr:hypothetical protein [Bacillota bacterium]